MDSPIKYLIKEIFIKAKEESGQTSIYGCCNYLEQRFRDDFKCYDGTSSRSFARLHQKYVEESQLEKATPKPTLLNAMSQYLGYQDYKDFLLNHGQTDKQLSFDLKATKFTKISISQRSIIAVLILMVCSLFSYIIFIDDYPPDPECMIWKNTHYEKISCELSLNIEKAGQIIGFDLKLYENMKMIPSSEVKVGESYYYKVGRDSVQFFSSRGLHPENGKDLKPVTDYIVGKYVQDKQTTQVQ